MLLQMLLFLDWGMSFDILMDRTLVYLLLLLLLVLDAL